MDTQQQAYIEGFVKRAYEYGFNQSEAIGILKEATRWRDEFLAGNIDAAPLYKMDRATQHIFDEHPPVGVELSKERLPYQGYKRDTAWKGSLKTRQDLADGILNLDYAGGVGRDPRKQELRQIVKEKRQLERALRDSITKTQLPTDTAAQKLIHEDNLKRVQKLTQQLDPINDKYDKLKNILSPAEFFEQGMQDVRKGFRATAPKSPRMLEIAKKVEEQAAKRMLKQPEQGVVSKLLSRIGQVLKRKGK